MEPTSGVNISLSNKVIDSYSPPPLCFTHDSVNVQGKKQKNAPSQGEPVAKNNTSLIRGFTTEREELVRGLPDLTGPIISAKLYSNHPHYKDCFFLQKLFYLL